MNPLPKNHHSLSYTSENPARHLSPVQVGVALSSPRYSTSPTTSSINTPTSNAKRRIAIAVDMSDDVESGYSIKWAITNYLRPGDAVILLHVQPTSVLYGADWGFCNTPSCTTPERIIQMENDYDKFINKKAAKLSQPLAEALIPFKIHIVKDHDLKERLCLEVERLGLSAVIMGSGGFGGATTPSSSAKKKSKGRLGSVSDYCVRHSVCPVVVVRYPHDDEEEDEGINNNDNNVAKKLQAENDGVVHPATVEDQEFHDAEDQEYHNAISEENGNSAKIRFNNEKKK